ncbi:MAG TPA: hypothetical protein VNN23_01865, partial [Ornithinibacter sp.]|nr:hypothetical protein [Ornithinibacter sp.]
MAAGAARHGARKRANGTTNALQALGVAGGGLLAVTVMTILAGGPADPALGETGSPTSSGSPTGVEGLARSGDPTGQSVVTVPVRSTTGPSDIPTPGVPTAPSGAVPAGTTGLPSTPQTDSPVPGSPPTPVPALPGTPGPTTPTPDSPAPEP